MLDHSANSGRHTLAVRGLDLYETPAPATRALLAVESLPPVIWEPACGPGAIVRVLRATGRTVIASDIVDYGCPDSSGGVDFLKAGLACDCVVTNPPYRDAEAFVRHAIALGASKIVMLLRLAFLESSKRTPLLDSGMLARVHVFKERLPMMHRHGWSGPRASSAIPFAWFVWDRVQNGPPTLHRISWREHCAKAQDQRRLINVEKQTQRLGQSKRAAMAEGNYPCGRSHDDRRRNGTQN
jgi:hypothetical protein